MALENATESVAVSDALDALMNEEESNVDAVDTAPESDAADSLETPEEETSEVEPAADAGELSALAEEAVSHYGLSREEVEKSGDLLPWVLARLDRQASVLMQQGESEAQPAAEAKPEEQGREPEKKREPLADLDAFEPKFDREDYDEPTLKVFDAFKDEINRQRATIKEHREAMQAMAQALVETHSTANELRTRSESSATTEFTTAMDDFFAKLPEEFRDIYGTEPMANLTNNSPKAAARNALVKEMRILSEFDAKAGRPARGNKEQAARTLRALHADKSHAVARREVDAQLKARRQSGIARPNGRATGKALDPLARKKNALNAIEKFMPKLGL